MSTTVTMPIEELENLRNQVAHYKGLIAKIENEGIANLRQFIEYHTVGCMNVHTAKATFDPLKNGVEFKATRYSDAEGNWYRSVNLRIKED